MIANRGIALLVTVFFIMLITLSVGVGLKYINESAKSIEKEQFLFQTTVILDDVLRILQTLKELEQVGSAVDLSTFLLTSEVIPFQSNGVEVVIKFSSARSRINPNALKDKDRLDAFKLFLSRKSINTVYGDILVDSMSGVKEDQTYVTDIFNVHPYAFRDYISSSKHLQMINEFYVNSYHDANFKYTDTKEIFYTSKDTNSSIDLNFATASTYEILLGCDTMRAQELSLREDVFQTIEEFKLELSAEEQINLSKFNSSIFEHYLDVNIQIMHKDKISNIRFEYNTQLKKGSNFVFEV
ncbi:MAG: hypothetical protein ACI9TV_000264 [Sulfurimonas sp.]|jgi:hypothetical protein|uniref:hypothetical protein n=1 Tax=Sulfurimonas sp. TaxID=2022749 RepID=UPI0039E2FBC4